MTGIDVLNILALLWIVIVLAGYLVPFAYGLPPTPARRQRIRRALKIAGLKPNETLVDLGCGDGRVLVIAAGEFGARAVGIDVGPVQCLQSLGASILGGVKPHVQVKWGSFFKQDLGHADVVFAYLTSGYVPRLSAQLASQLKPGSRVVTISFDFPEWEPSAFDQRELIFLYRMPPAPGSLESYLFKQG
jgi:SAM-dependent methyltransferase